MLYQTSSGFRKRKPPPRALTVSTFRFPFSKGWLCHENSTTFRIHQLVKTADGSHTLFLPEANQHYHSCHGAINESNHVFIQNGLEYYAVNKSGVPINILEVGMGTGLNVLLAFLYSVNDRMQSINYFAIEPFPIAKDIVDQLNYPTLLTSEQHTTVFNLIHSAVNNEKTRLAEQFLFIKKPDKLECFECDTLFDIVFFDAFSPAIQPELWTQTTFERLYTLMKPGGILVTYCAKGEVKRNLRAAGFSVESLPGPTGKREMTRARRSI